MNQILLMKLKQVLQEMFLENDNNKKLEIINSYINKINDLKISKESKDSLNKDFKDFKNMLVPES